jgi:competence protein ComGC
MYNKKARSFVAIMIIVAIVSLLLRFAIHKLIVYNMEQSQSLAQVNIKLLSTALENYAKDNKGAYPVHAGQLTKGNPAYLENDYLAVSSVRGYQYDCLRMDLTVN